MGAVGHPLIHLGYAYEFSSREVGMEALAIVASEYNFLHKYTDDTSYTQPSAYTSTSPLEILQKISTDARFDNLFTHKGSSNLGPLFEQHESLVLEYWNAWTLSDPLKQFQDSQDAAVALLTATVAAGAADYDFFLVHVLTTSHAVRILLPFIPAKFHIGVVRQWWLLTIAVYICQLRPRIDKAVIKQTEVGEKGWKYVEHQAVAGKWATNSHYVKGPSPLSILVLCVACD
jgi:hypothetical protein